MCEADFQLDGSCHDCSGFGLGCCVGIVGAALSILLSTLLLVLYLRCHKQRRSNSNTGNNNRNEMEPSNHTLLGSGERVDGPDNPIT